MPISYSANQYGPAYEFGVWLREHSGEILEALQSPKVWLLVVVGLFVVLLILAGVVGAAARAYYFLRLSLEIRAGAITVGYRRTRPLDVLIDPPLRLSFPDRCMHTQVVAPTRQGKTSMMSSWLHQDLAEGHTVMVNEMMGDLGDKACEAARDVGAPISDFDPTSADTLKWNPLYARSWQELEAVAERAVAAFEVVGASTNPYYRTVNHVVMRRVIYAAWAFAVSVGYQPDFSLVKRFLEDEEYLRYALQIAQDGAGRPRVDLDNLDSHDPALVRRTLLSMEPRRAGEQHQRAVPDPRRAPRPWGGCRSPPGSTRRTEVGSPARPHARRTHSLQREGGKDGGRAQPAANDTDATTHSVGNPQSGWHKLASRTLPGRI